MASFWTLPHSVRRGTIIEPNGVLRAAQSILPPTPHAMTDVLDSVREGRLLRLTLNRPDKRNALDANLCRALVRALDDAAGDPAVGAIVLTGNGKAFCAGMDLAEIAEGADTTEINAVHEQLFTIGARLTKPLIAGVHGAALAGGTGLVANCHIVVAGPEASLWPHRNPSGALAVPGLSGRRRPRWESGGRWNFRSPGRTFGGAEAREFGLVHEAGGRRRRRGRSKSPGRSPGSVRRRCGAEWPSSSEVRGLDWEAAGAVAREVRNQVFTGEDFQEGIRAFREKRSPRVAFDQGQENDCHSIIVDMRH